MQVKEIADTLGFYSGGTQLHKSARDLSTGLFNRLLKLQRDRLPPGKFIIEKRIKQRDNFSFFN